MARGDKPSRLDRTPIRTLRGKRLFAWLWAYLAAAATTALVFFPIRMALQSTDLPFLPALLRVFATSMFMAMTPGLFVAVLILGPIWLVLRFWIARQGDDAIGGRPAVWPVWLGIWLILTLIPVFLANPASVSAPSGAFGLLPYPVSLMFNNGVLVQMAGVTAMFLFYQGFRPKDTT